MTISILLLGASGYIGGSTLATLLERHPTWNVTALARNEDQASKIQAAFPSTKLSTVLGSLDTPDILATEAAKASITLQLANGDHDAGTNALLSAVRSAATLESCKYYIHLSGAATVLDFSLAPGLAPGRSWNDTSDLPAILSLPSTQIHAATEQRIVATGTEHAANGLRTAIVSPPAVVGVGSGPLKKGANYHINMTMQRKRAFVVEQGQNVWEMVHVKDTAGAIVALVEAAYGELQDRAYNPAAATAAPSRADWNDQGYYFLTSGWVSPDKVSYVRAIVSRLREKRIPLEDGLDHLTADEVTALHPFGQIIFGSSLRIHGERIRERLGWESAFTKWEGALEEEVNAEIARVARGEKLGVGFGHD
ncbi:NAD(P)-binding protein [Penicillium alfredii]|uniref:NAD(P)-binding protein n=1 Tax=Penicillium alfredii TaxID=1506179 RepID=A0A9W9K749_9EURO|nr:NAD(P)-binding protein [Penicillium alfredii]KAJ5095579.1 NAD(P)-binding protein [Penicillium alfredii]